jgi:hypothetical protein
MRRKCWLIIPLFFLSIADIFSQHYNYQYLIPFRQKKLWGFSDTLGNIKISPVYAAVDFFTLLGTDYYAEVFKENKKSLLLTSGKLAAPFFDSLVRFDDEYYYAKDNNKYGIYHLRKKITVPLVYDSLIPVENYLQQKEWGYYKIIGIKDNKYYLVTYINNTTKEIEKPVAMPSCNSNSQFP